MSSDFPNQKQIASAPGPGTIAHPARDSRKPKSKATHLRLAYSNPMPLPKEDDLVAAVLRILNTSALDMSDITVTAKGADITLSGSIRGKREAFRAAAVASSVRGVRIVHNELFGW
ncbi:BON domain-containing protein [Rhizobium sp. BK376]|nr:BON domain-containing protein [Rhizobium sp. BK376]